MPARLVSPRSANNDGFGFSSGTRFLFVRYLDLIMFGNPLPQHPKLSTPSIWRRGLIALGKVFLCPAKELRSIASDGRTTMGIAETPSGNDCER